MEVVSGAAIVFFLGGRMTKRSLKKYSSKSKTSYIDSLKLFLVRILSTALFCVVVTSLPDSSNLSNVGIAFVWASFHCAFIVDWKTHIIPDRCHFFGILGSWLLLYDKPELLTENLILAGVMSSALILAGHWYSKKTGKQAMGWGDVKLLSWIFILVGKFGAYILLMATLTAFLHQYARKNSTQPFAFGPYLISSTALILGGLGLWTKTLAFL